MYLVVIIDDEPVIVEGLKKLVPWEKYSCTVAECASDAISAEAVIQRHRPDILFTDIRMPGTDGLSVLSRLREEFPAMEVTVLTGYRDFDYAQKAINLGVTRFLLKPSRMEELCEAAEAMTNNLRKRGILPDSRLRTAESEKDEVSGSFIVRNAMKYIEEHYSEKITLLEVAENIYVSQWHLSKLLNKHTNQNFSELLNNVRVEEGKKLLSEPGLKVHEVSEKIGFSDVTHFSKIFRKVVGMSPNEYRNRNK